MPCQPITHLDDPRIAVYRSLKLTNQTRGLGHFVVEGAKLLERLLASRFPVVSVLATDRSAGLIEPMLPANIRFRGAVRADPRDRRLPVSPRSLACGQRVPWSTWEETSDKASPPHPGRLPEAQQPRKPRFDRPHRRRLRR